MHAIFAIKCDAHSYLRNETQWIQQNKSLPKMQSIYTAINSDLYICHPSEISPQDNWSNIVEEVALVH